MMHGEGAIGRISYTEFTEMGQPKILGRYPIHFHLVGDASASYAVGNSVHDTFARVLTIHGTHYLKVQYNVGYNSFGHSIFLEDGIEKNNIIQDNLIIGSKQIFNMLQTDITVSNYWVTNPYNILRRNHAAGSEWYLFWY